jgi:hypothetical protein
MVERLKGKGHPLDKKKILMVSKVMYIVIFS